MIEHEQYYRKGGTYELPIEIYNDLIGQIEEAQKERNDYKQRNEKAIEYIKNLSNKPNVFGHYGIDTRCKKWLLKILKGK